MSRRGFQLGLLLLWFALNPAQAQDIVVAVPTSSPVQSLSPQEVADIFLSRTHDSPALTPYDSGDTDIRSQFYRRVAKLSLTRLRAYWAKKVFTGRDQPPKALSPDQIRTQFANNPQTISYFPVDGLPSGARIVTRVTDNDGGR